jgi:hypothetical protein
MALGCCCSAVVGAVFASDIVPAPWLALVDADFKERRATMIIQSAPSGTRRLAVMMYEHTALAHQFARAFGNQAFEPIAPNDLMFHVILHHDAGWAEFDRNPATDAKTDLPYNLVETPAKYITVTSLLSPDYNERHHPFCGLMSSMHSWGLYNGRYGLSNMVLIDQITPEERPLAKKLLDAELDRQERLKKAVSQDPAVAERLDRKKLFQNYKQLQFCDTLALYFNRTHPDLRAGLAFDNVPSNADEDTTVTIRPLDKGVYALSPYPFGGQARAFAFAGRFIEPGQHRAAGGWPAVFAAAPTIWETFTLVAE